jgi:hypothetical protein
MGQLKQNLILNPSLKPGAIDITFLRNGMNTRSISPQIDARILDIDYVSTGWLNQLTLPLIRIIHPISIFLYHLKHLPYLNWRWEFYILKEGFQIEIGSHLLSGQLYQW